MGAVFKPAIRASIWGSFRDSWFLAPTADDARVLRELGLKATDRAHATATWVQPCRRLIIVVGDRPAELRAASALACTIAAQGATEVGLCILPGLGSRYSSLRHWCAVHDFVAMVARTLPWPSSAPLEAGRGGDAGMSLRGLGRSAIDLWQATAAMLQAPDPGARGCPLEAARVPSCLGPNPTAQSIGQEWRVAIARCRRAGIESSSIASHPSEFPGLPTSLAMILQTVDLPYRPRVEPISVHAATMTVHWCRLRGAQARTVTLGLLDRQVDSSV
jgi:hypothetical protein